MTITVRTFGDLHDARRRFGTPLKPGQTPRDRDLQADADRAARRRLFDAQVAALHGRR